MSNYPKIVAFPNDDMLRVIWWYGPVFKNLSDSNTPLVKILTKLLSTDGKLSELNQIFEVTLPELDIVRLGTVWRGQKRTNSIWKYYNGYVAEQEFKFDFTVNQPLSIHFSDKKPDSNFWHIPKFKYDLGDLTKHAENRFQFYNSTLTKLISTEGIAVLIPSLEFLTSAVSPEHKQIRAGLLQHSLDNLTSRHLKSAHEDTNGDYAIELIEGRLDANLTLLAYLRLNAITRTRISKLWASMQKTSVNKATGLKYEEKYPEVLPYHPSELTLQGDGIKIDEKTFLLLRINGVSIPTDHAIRLISTIYGSHPKNKNPQTYEHGYYNPEEVEADDLYITHRNEPHWQAGVAHIRSEVKIIGPRPNITEQINLKENNVPRIPKDEEKQEASDLSSGEPDSRNESAGTVALKQAALEDNVPLSDNFEKIETALHTLVNDAKSIIANFLYIGNNGSENVIPTYCMISRNQLPPEYTGKWHTSEKVDNGTGKPKYRLRKFLIMKITLKDGKSCYLLEIQHKISESFFALLFGTQFGGITSETITNLLSTIAMNKGKYTRRGNSALIPLELPVSPSMVFRHYENIDMSNQLMRAIERGIKKNLFTFSA